MMDLCAAPPPPGGGGGTHQPDCPRKSSVSEWDSTFAGFGSRERENCSEVELALWVPDNIKLMHCSLCRGDSQDTMIDKQV